MHQVLEMVGVCAPWHVLCALSYTLHYCVNYTLKESFSKLKNGEQRI